MLTGTKLHTLAKFLKSLAHEIRDGLILDIYLFGDFSIISSFIEVKSQDFALATGQGLHGLTELFGVFRGNLFVDPPELKGHFAGMPRHDHLPGFASLPDHTSL